MLGVLVNQHVSGLQDKIVHPADSGQCQQGQQPGLVAAYRQPPYHQQQPVNLTDLQAPLQPAMVAQPTSTSASAPNKAKESAAGEVQHLPELQAARNALAGLLLQRVRDMQLLTSCPLLGRRRSPAELARLLDQAEEAGSEGAAWQALGMHKSPLLELVNLPDLIRPDLWGPLDLLLVLCGHVSPSQPQDASQLGRLASNNKINTSPSKQPAAAAPHDGHVVLPNLQPGAAEVAGGAAHHAAGGCTNVNPLSFPSLLNNQGGVSGSSYTDRQGVLPHSVSGIAALPALQQVPTASMEWLRTFMSDLRPQQRHVGVDDRLHPWFRELKVEAAKALLQEGSSSLCRGFSKFGVPHGCRAVIWQVALGLGLGPVSQSEGLEFDALVHEACCQPMPLADTWAVADSALIRDSPHFFLFEDMLRAVMLAFLRDPRVTKHCAVAPHPWLLIDPTTAGRASNTTSEDVSKVGNTVVGSFPASGCLLPHGSIMLMAPLCFMYEDPAAVYRMHRALYCRYWCKLHSLSTLGLPSPALPVLLRTYETLLQELDLDLFQHLSQLGVAPAAVAIPWITRAFVGYLPVEEVLLLWDRVIGLDSLLPVAQLATAIMCFRRQVLLSCTAAREVLEAMADISQLQTMPLLQALLFQA